MSQIFDALRRTNVRDAIYTDAENKFSTLQSNFSGNSFPSNAAVGQLCYRTDLGKYHKWNGSAWVECGNVTEQQIQNIENTLALGVFYEYIDGAVTISLPSSSET